MNEEKHEDWVAIFTSTTDYEADMVRDRLDSSGIPAVVLTQRDHAFNLNVGDLAEVHVMVPPANETEARELLQETITDDELDEASRIVEPDDEGHTSDDPETMFDSGNEDIHFSPPDDDGEDNNV